MIPMRIPAAGRATVAKPMKRAARRTAAARKTAVARRTTSVTSTMTTTADATPGAERAVTLPGGTLSHIFA